MAVFFQEDSIGLILRLSLVDGDGSIISLATESTITFIFLDPSGVRTTRVGYVYGDPTLGVVGYTTVSGDFTTVGIWKYQAEIVFASGATLYTTVNKIKVKANI